MVKKRYGNVFRLMLFGTRSPGLKSPETQLQFNEKVICEHLQPSDPIMALANSLIMTVRRCPMVKSIIDLCTYWEAIRGREGSEQRRSMVQQQWYMRCTGSRELWRRSVKWPKLQKNNAGTNNEMRHVPKALSITWIGYECLTSLYIYNFNQLHCRI